MKINYKESVIVTFCPICHDIAEIAVNDADYWDWKDGMLVQNAFPYLTAAERESLISGICPTCWNEMFSSEISDDEWPEEE